MYPSSSYPHQQHQHLTPICICSIDRGSGVATWTDRCSALCSSFGLAIGHTSGGDACLSLMQPHTTDAAMSVIILGKQRSQNKRHPFFCLPAAAAINFSIRERMATESMQPSGRERKNIEPSLLVQYQTHTVSTLCAPCISLDDLGFCSIGTVG